MDIIRKVFLVGPIYKTLTIASLFYTMLFLFLIGIVTLPYLYTGINQWLTFIMILLLTYLFAVQLTRRYMPYAIIKSRSYTIGLNDTPTRFFQSSVHDELGVAKKVELIADGDKWRLFDATFHFITKTKYGSFVSKQAFYTVYEHQLTRSLPNLIFDSTRAKGKQYRYRYLSEQKLSLEGDFDQYFDTYSPQYYSIDTLSFITPEVMHQLIAACRYDVEIIDDRLFLYGPLLAKNEIPDIKLHGQTIAAAINDNIDNYKDSYLTGKNRHVDVTSFASRLLRSPLKPFLLATLSGVGSVAVLIVAAINKSFDIAFNSPAVYLYIFFFGTLFSALKIINENKKQRASFLAMHKYTGR